MHRLYTLGTAALVLSTIAGANHAQAQIRYQGMDRNNDGVITRGEWRGNEQSFRNQDWNGDGVLSGDEIRPGARRQTGWNQDWNHDGIINQQDTLISQQFRRYDSNGDDRVSSREWPGNQRLFARLDSNRDGYLTMSEYTTNNGGFRMDAQGGPSFSFNNLDRNRDGWITRNEWIMSGAEFNRFDANRDNRISNYEFQNDGNEESQNSASFLAVDHNRDGWITRAESGMSYAEFNRFDSNNDNRLSRFEFESARHLTPEAERSAAWRTGYDRGIAEGRNAGREDRVNNHGWDLDGQTELERADSGYNSQLGSLSDYQAGYRDGFRAAYREGYNSR